MDTNFQKIHHDYQHKTLYLVKYLRRGKREGHPHPNYEGGPGNYDFLHTAVLVSFHTSVFSTLPHSVFITIKMEQDTCISIDTRVEYL